MPKDIVLNQRTKVDILDDEGSIASWFSNYQKPDSSTNVRTYILDNNKITQLEEFMVQVIPDCYISESNLTVRINKTGLSASEIIQNKLPNTGSVMAGDFGEVLTLFYLGSESSLIVKKIKKWRYKQDRTKAAPHSDVVILYREHTERASTNDFVICAESKLKSTTSTFSPIEKSIEGYVKDNTGRMARTLLWLKEKAIDHEDVDDIAFVERFTDKLLDIKFNKKYRAVAIVDSKFLDNELVKSLELPVQDDEFEIIVLCIDNLKNLYEQSFSKSISELADD